MKSLVSKGFLLLLFGAFINLSAQTTEEMYKEKEIKTSKQYYWEEYTGNNIKDGKDSLKKQLFERLSRENNLNINKSEFDINVEHLVYEIGPNYRIISYVEKDKVKQDIRIHPKIPGKIDVALVDLENENLLRAMESNSSVLLTEINRAFLTGQDPSISKEVITPRGMKRLIDQWKTCRFYCVQPNVIERILFLKEGSTYSYEVRNIQIRYENMHKYDENSKDTASLYREICLKYDKTGLIEDVFCTIDNAMWKRFFTGDTTIASVSRRCLILEFLEDLRTAYNRKDINFLEQVYSENALIITTKEIIIKKEIEPNKFIQYTIYKNTVQDKSTYLTNLQNKVFKASKYLDVLFDNVELFKSGAAGRENFYGVRLKQSWSTPNYKDVGSLFMIIEFISPDSMLIHVRVWQPLKPNLKLVDLTDFP